MKRIILMISLFFSNLTFAIPPTVMDLESSPEIKVKLQELSQNGWEKSGTSQLISIESFYYNNNSQGQTLMLVVPIYGRKYLTLSCVAALFNRGGSSEYRFKEFAQIKGYCQ